MLPLRLFRPRAFSPRNGAGFLLHFAMFAGFLLIIQFLTQVHGDGPLAAGLQTLPWTAMPLVVSPVRRPARRRIGRRPLIAAGGLLLVAAGILALALLASAGASSPSSRPLVAIGVGIGLVLPNVASAALAAVPARDIGKASGILSTSRQVGSVAGVSVGLAIYQAASGAGAAASPAGSAPRSSSPRSRRSGARSPRVSAGRGPCARRRRVA